MSVPRPAMFVAIVTDLCCPILEIISASRAWFFAFNVSCGIFAFVNKSLINSLVSMAIVPIRTGCPASYLSFTKLIMALYLAAFVANTKSGASIRITSLFVGIQITYIL